MRTVAVEGVGQVTLRDAKDLTVRQRRPIEVLSMRLGPILPKLAAIADSDSPALEDLDLTEDQASIVFDLQDATIVAAVAAWDRPEPVPTRDTVGDLPGSVYDALAMATRALATDAAPVDFAPSLQEASPTGSSGLSSGPGATAAG